METITSLFCFSATFQASVMIFFVSKHYEKDVAFSRNWNAWNSENHILSSRCFVKQFFMYYVLSI